MRSAMFSYQYELAFAAATIFSTTGRRSRSNAASARGTSSPASPNARSSAIASSNASRVPEPIEKCPVRSASPIRTTGTDEKRATQFRFDSSGNCRQMDLFDTSGWPPRSGANTRSQYARDASSVIVSKPALSQVGASHSTTKVLMSGA